MPAHLPHRGEIERHADGDRDIRAGVVQLHVPGVFHAEEHGEHHHQPKEVEHQPLQRPPGVGASAARAVHLRDNQQQRAHLHGEDAQHQQRMRWADDLYIEAISVVPPVVEGRRGNHGHSAPRRQEGAQRSAQSEDVHGICRHLFRRRKGGTSGLGSRRRSRPARRTDRWPYARASRKCRGRWSGATKHPSARRWSPR